ncbi:MAG: RagB/SusD family nutrient uptake outer membrane protein [Cytophagales bacterium]|nr:RagB/SusD family nutrient uptake outer membrane protein [Cytophagales bacterium]
MRYSLKILLGIIMLIGTHACNDVLETSPSTQLSQDTFWKTTNDAELGLNGIYRILGGYWLYGGQIYLDVISNNSYNNYPWEGYTALANGTHDANQPGCVNGRWSTCWRGIGRANTFLANIDNVDMDDNHREKMKAEALFLRAVFYINLVDFYGGVPILLDAPNLEQGTEPRATKEAVINQILIDLDAAAAKLPDSYSGSDVGRATKGAAIGMKTRVLLYDEKWTEAAAAAEDVMDLGYGLFGDYGDLFLPENENNEEIIFDVQFKSPEFGHAWDTYISPLGGATNGWSSLVPMQNLIDDYEMIDGLSIDESPLYDPDNPFKDRDPRFERTFWYPGTTISGTPFDPSSSYTGYAYRKYTEYDENPRPFIPYPNGSQTNAIVVRYADILLMYAEAQNEDVGPDQTVYDAINAVRRRADMPLIPPGKTQDEMRQIIRHERRIELVFEGWHYKDLLRWGIAQDEIDGLVDPGGTRKFNEDRDTLWPIPSREFDIEGTPLEQNPNYGK